MRGRTIPCRAREAYDEPKKKQPPERAAAVYDAGNQRMEKKAFMPGYWATS